MSRYSGPLSPAVGSLLVMVPLAPIHPPPRRAAAPPDLTLTVPGSPAPAPSRPVLWVHPCLWPHCSLSTLLLLLQMGADGSARLTGLLYIWRGVLTVKALRYKQELNKWHQVFVVVLKHMGLVTQDTAGL